MTRSRALAARGTVITAPSRTTGSCSTSRSGAWTFVVTNRGVMGKTIGGAGRARGVAEGVFLRQLTRVGQAMPFSAETRVDRGDVPAVSLIRGHGGCRAGGAGDRLCRIAPTVMTDMIFVGLGIFLGGLVGLLTIVVGVSRSPSPPAAVRSSWAWSSAGCARCIPRSDAFPSRPSGCSIPSGWTVFIGVVGLSAGPSFVSGLQKSGMSRGLVGVVVRDPATCRRPPPLRPICPPDEPAHPFGRVYRSGDDHRRPAEHTSRKNRRARSCRPSAGYTVPYAVGNILLTAWGPVIVALLS